MIRIKNHRQLSLFDPFESISPKRRKMLEKSWAGLFYKEILLSLPVKKIAPYFDKSFGRPTKDLHTVLGVLVLQQTFDLTDMETVEQFAFNLQWHYALNIAEESDAAKYMCPKTLWNMRKMVSTNDLDSVIFESVTKKLANVFKVDTTTQRIDSTHIQSNMKRLGRICIFTETINKFLKELRKEHIELFEGIDQGIVEKYLPEKALQCFSMLKPSESRKKLTEVSKDLFTLLEQFKTMDEVRIMESYALCERVLQEQCNLPGSEEKKVEVKSPKDIPSDSLQNPSDPDATYSGHKGQGYQVQIMETYSNKEDKKSLDLITYVDVEPAHKSDANALIPAIESVKKQSLQPQELLADSLYGSDKNYEKAKQEHSVELIAPVMGHSKNEGISLSDFKVSENDHIISCPQGQRPVKVKKNGNRTTVSFDSDQCQSCPHQAKCPVKKGKKFYYLRYTDKEMRIAHRRVYECTDAFIERYRWRAGIEATMSKYKRRTGVKRLRVRGFKAVRYSAVLKALAVNIFRAAAFQCALTNKKLCYSISHLPHFLNKFVSQRLFFIWKYVLNQYTNDWEYYLSTFAITL